ncbi:MAG: hypothetical protein IPO91_28760 [Chloroflexi bacterium]|nr:hypothetical protein [Chloroflexota bacterium]
MKKLILLLFLIALPLHAQEATDEPFPPEGWVTAEHGQLRLIAGWARRIAPRPIRPSLRLDGG